MTSRSKSRTDAPRRPTRRAVSPAPPILPGPPPATLAARRRRADLIFARFKAACPEPRCELYFRTPFQLLISVMLSAQTTDKAVNAAMHAAYDAGFDPETALALGEAGVRSLIRRVGLAPTKAKRVVAIARLVRDRGGDLPADREGLEALPGVGRKTASVVLAELHGAPTLAVDTHVFRVAGRLGLHDDKSAEAAEATLLQVVAERHRPAAHHWLILHGRYVCMARKPACDRCLVADLCPSAAILGPSAAAGKPPRRPAAIEEPHAQRAQVRK